MNQEMQQEQEGRRGKYPMSVRTRVSIETYEKILDAAEMAGVSLGRYARFRLEGSKVPDKSKLRLANELKRQGGLMLKLARQGQSTDEVKAEIMKTLKQIQQQITGE